MTALTQQKARERFLEVFAETGNVTLAAKAGGISRQAHYMALQRDPSYAEAFRHAEEQAADRLEAEAWRRAVEGTEKPVFQGGELVGVRREYSDLLLIFLLKGARPEKYNDRLVRVESPGADRLAAAMERVAAVAETARRGMTVESTAVVLASADASG